MDPWHYVVFRGARRMGRSSGQSGLTGPSDIPEPDFSSGPKNLRGRIRSIWQALHGTLAALPRVFRLVWEASPPQTIGLFVATVLAGVVPAATALTAKLLINAVVQGILIRARNLPDQYALTVSLPFKIGHL